MFHFHLLWLWHSVLNQNNILTCLAQQEFHFNLCTSCCSYSSFGCMGLVPTPANHSCKTRWSVQKQNSHLQFDFAIRNNWDDIKIKRLFSVVIGATTSTVNPLFWFVVFPKAPSSSPIFSLHTRFNAGISANTFAVILLVSSLFLRSKSFDVAKLYLAMRNKSEIVVFGQQFHPREIPSLSWNSPNKKLLIAVYFPVFHWFLESNTCFYIMLFRWLQFDIFKAKLKKNLALALVQNAATRLLFTPVLIQRFLLLLSRVNSYWLCSGYFCTNIKHRSYLNDKISCQCHMDLKSLKIQEF